MGGADLALVLLANFGQKIVSAFAGVGLGAAGAEIFFFGYEWELIGSGELLYESRVGIGTFADAVVEMRHDGRRVAAQHVQHRH